MFNQMEFMMQLYMMNLLQQQQLQQQQIQQQPPQQEQQQLLGFAQTQTEDISSSTCLQQQQQQQPQKQHKTRTDKRTNSQNTNCSSSSRSCSPNSNLNTLSSKQQQQCEEHATSLLTTPTKTNSANINFAQQLPQLLFSNISPLTHFMLQQQQQQQQHLLTTSTSNQLLTPNTPSSTQQLQLDQLTRNNFLQSSAVTSTPNEQSAAVAAVAAAAATSAAAAATTTATANVTGNIPADTVKYEQYFDDEDDKPLSSLNSCSSSGMASTNDATSATSANSEKLLLLSGIQSLESTSINDGSINSPSMYTPVKQPADSSYSAMTSIDNDEETFNTPLPQSKNSLLTPPPSNDQSKASIVSLSTASGLDAFLLNEENLKYLRKVSSYLECENVLCRQDTLREHFHCYDEPCQGKTLSKKDDIIRHLKWHKKRKESLKLGFARFSSGDDCAPAYGDSCAYNWKQTHYHCIYEHCPKVYVSTSDVQMHANFHRKDSEIVNEGFRRFRAHENCRVEDCPFYGKKISHYHCCREGCNHTFKNKADMDKHKTYHLKHSQLTQDGFKKILKTEPCPFESCKFSMVSNHIHCLRVDCNHILHSSSQMISHKRKHDRDDGEQQLKSKQDDLEDAPQTQATIAPELNSNSFSSTSTPLSSLSTEHFLARKRGRPPKMIQLPVDAQQSEAKRLKLADTDSFPTPPTQLPPSSNSNALNSGLLASLLPNFMPVADATAPNFQMTHLMALFQLQNPLFYQNMYPGTTDANIMQTLPQNSPVLGNLAAFNVADAAADAVMQQPKTEFGIEPEFKE
ncbi:transcription factor castor [Drosophila grimshawi]|uniref:GH18114 n=1 Tax=Drosophila grimshawi TaxID=7222 RepID=B4JGY2_DROGR|nr:transcription factor castor [Drosophila grimshawi]EDV93760.1 GH18114 [Drosophila grimshawi]